MKKHSTIYAPISIAELFYKISILQIKSKIMIGEKLINIKKEILFLEETIKTNNLKIDSKIYNKLKEINQTFWIVEDKLRIKEFEKEFIN